jgi:peptide/nickel transport system permease protein
MAANTLAPRPTARDIGAAALREPSRLERTVGPDWYRIIRGLVTNPLSVAGLIIIALFVLIGVFAPFLAPPLGKSDIIPRDGYNPEPRAPGSEWRQRPPPLPSGTRPHRQDRVGAPVRHRQRPVDIYYGIVWGTRGAVHRRAHHGRTLAIGILVGCWPPPWRLFVMC